MYFYIGMENEKLDKSGKAFYTTKQNGMGLRLAITYKIIEEYQGVLRFKVAWK
ncbi:C4-dicarboxylate-specific signal transduction histidine kinase [Bacillus sp. TE9106W]|nr:sensor histidine kinase domain protein [Bacillus cereus SJ1]PRP99751.1 Sporulation kinase E [Bacillus sp. M21]